MGKDTWPKKGRNGRERWPHWVLNGEHHPEVSPVCKVLSGNYILRRISSDAFEVVRISDGKAFPTTGAQVNDILRYRCVHRMMDNLDEGEMHATAKGAYNMAKSQ